MASAILAPRTATAQEWRRDQTANEWKTIATISGALGLLGALNHDDTLAFAGAAGALYSTYRYDQDRNSRDARCRARSAYFDREYFIRDGHRFERREVWQHGVKYYQFVNCDYDSRSHGSDWRQNRDRLDQEDRRRAEERREAEARRRDEERRREESRRRDEERRREEDRRRDQEKWDRDHRNDRNRDNGNRGNSRDNGNRNGRNRDDDRRDRDNRDNRDNGRGD